MEQRLREVEALQRAITYERQRRWVGREVRVLVEARARKGGEVWVGRSPREAPEVDGHIEFTSPRPLAPGSFVSVRVERATPLALQGTVVERER
jgi:ribosomal protein S12 methylthiotransferase